MTSVKNLEWYEGEDGGWTDDGEDSAKVWKAVYRRKNVSFYIEVYPLSLINKNLKGWEYRIIWNDGGKNEDEYDSAFESCNGDFAPTDKIAMKWAEDTLSDILEDMKNKK